jgi:hypothetical protein
MGFKEQGVQVKVQRDAVYQYRKKPVFTTICPRHGEATCCHPDGVLFVRAADAAGNRLPLRDADAVDRKGLEYWARDALKNHAQEWHGDVKSGKKTLGKPKLLTARLLRRARRSMRRRYARTSSAPRSSRSTSDGTIDD